MKENILKKEFKRKDVERVRNLVKGKNGAKTTIGIGYTGDAQVDHKEGDVWEEDGRTWTIKDGIKENITKLDKFKKVSVPIFCPTCKEVMDKQLDPFYYKAYGECLDCRAKFETKLKKEGKWEEYTTNIYNSEIDQYIEDYKLYMEASMNESNESYVSEDGDIQKWVGGVNKERAQQAMVSTLEYLEGLKKK